jgi:thioredoxin reductase
VTVAIAGAGPAGITVALTLAASGIPVTLIDEWSTVGGSLRYANLADRNGDAADLIAQVTNSSVHMLTDSVVWAAFRHEAGFELSLNRHGENATLLADQVVLATGTTDVVTSWPGSTLPGVITERAFRVLVNSHGVIPGASIAIVGGAGSSRLAADIRRWGLDVRFTNLSAKMVQSVNGSDRVESVSLSDGSTIAADTVVLALGEAPDVQLAGMLGVAPTFDVARSGWYVQSSNPMPGLWLAGGTLSGSASTSDVISSARQIAGDVIDHAKKEGA